MFQEKLEEEDIGVRSSKE